MKILDYDDLLTYRWIHFLSFPVLILLSTTATDQCEYEPERPSWIWVHCTNTLARVIQTATQTGVRLVYFGEVKKKKKNKSK